MKKTVFRLSLCLLAVGVSIIESQIVNADTTTKKLSENSKDLNNQITGTINSMTNASENGESKQEDSSATESASDNTALSLATAEAIDGNPTSNSVVNQDDTENITNETITPFSVASLPEGATSRAASNVVTSQAQLKNAIKAGAAITLGANITVNSEITYNTSFSINGTYNGARHALQFTGNGQLKSLYGSSKDNVTFENIDIVSSASEALLYVGNSAGTNLTLNNTTYTTTNGCPVVTSDGTANAWSVLILSGKNAIKSSGNGQTLFNYIKDVNVQNDGTEDNSTTINVTGGKSDSAIFYLSRYSDNYNHSVNVTSGSRLTIDSTRNILFDVDYKGNLVIGKNAYFTYSYTGGNSNSNSANAIFGGNLTPGNSSNSLVITAEENSQTLFETNGAPATCGGFDYIENKFENEKVQVNAYEPDFVQFHSSENTAAVFKNLKINFANKEDTSATATTNPYVLGETPIGSSDEARYPIKVNGNRSMTTGKLFQNVIYYKESPEENLTLTAFSSVGSKKSTISSELGGLYTNYTNVEMVAVPTEITDVSDTSVANAVSAVNNDTTGKSGYYQAGTITSDGKLNDFTNVWAGTYYLYAKLTNESTNKSSDWLKATVTVDPYLVVDGKNTINFYGGYKLTLKNSATIESVGNTDIALTYSSMSENDGSSANVTLVNKITAKEKQLQLNMTAKNDNSTTLWSPMSLNATSFDDKVILSPYWTNPSKSQAVFSVDGEYSGPLGKNQIEEVSYKVTMGISQNK